jgi:asparagine synthetase B (glutamine-hydrolysing)
VPSPSGELSPDRLRRRAKRVREIVLRELETAPRRTAVLLSSGVDSQLVFRALCELDREPVALSFRVDGREPRDWRTARATAEELGRPFFDVPLLPHLIPDYVRWAVRFGLRSKTGVECFWPRKAALEAAHALRCPAVATGDGGDGYHGVSKRAILHCRDTVEKLDEFRRAYYAKPDWSQTSSIRRYADTLGLDVFMPLAAPDLLDLFLGLTWEEANLPRQKVILRRAFRLPDLPPHINLQLGDSGIAEAFAEAGGVRMYNAAALPADREAAGQGSLL